MGLDGTLELRKHRVIMHAWKHHRQRLRLIYMEVVELRPSLNTFSGILTVVLDIIERQHV
jgi:hypothetical protein